MLSVLQKAEGIETYPFPHIVIENALPDSIYDHLLKTRPDVTGVQENSRYDIRAKDSLNFPVLWRQFVQYHCSKEFYKEVDALFDLGLKGEVGMRFKDDVPIKLDCQVSINTPTSYEGRVCEAHYDNPETKFAGLLYMGEDDAGLEIYDCKDPEYYGKRRVRNPGNPVKVIHFKHNTFIGLLNTPLSIHAPETRTPTDRERKFVNFCIDS